ncbi:MAG: glycosyltransferase family 39 protein [Candidatus Omnitrophica bacterium]|nr:glycosyltransferase family 39 protein [Candidatus Omnitrophota bacterium]
MKINLNKHIILLAAIFVAAFIIRFYQLSFFEYKNDQYFAIGLGNDTRAAHFLVTHGMRSGIGVNNPPAFSYAMGVLTAFTNDPAQLTFFFFCINILALILAIIYFYRTLPVKYAILSTAFLALFPASTLYSSNIWAQFFLPLIMILFNISLYRFVKYELWRNFFYMGLLAVLAAQFHMSGFFLFPLLAVIAAAYWKKIDKKEIWLVFLAVSVLFIPYLIHLFKDMELFKLFAYGASAKRAFPWKIFLFHLRMASFDFFRYYFRYDFNVTLRSMAGFWRFILYPLTFIPAILFASGFFSYLKWLIKGRKLFNINDDARQGYPLPFQVSGFMILVVTLGYLIFRVRTPMHYFIVLYPAYGLITGFTAFRIWKIGWGKPVVLLGIISTVILLLAALLFLDRAGGHPYEYGISYKALVSWQKELRSIRPQRSCWDLRINFIGEGKADKETVYSMLSDGNKCAKGDKIIPVDFNISWDNKLMRYQHYINIIK